MTTISVMSCYIVDHVADEIRSNEARVTLHLDESTSDAVTTAGQEAVKKLRAKETYKKQTNRYQYVCFCSKQILTSQIIAEIIETILNFLAAKIAAISMFQIDLDKTWNYPRYCFEKSTFTPLFGVPDVSKVTLCVVTSSCFISCISVQLPKRHPLTTNDNSARQ